MDDKTLAAYLDRIAVARPRVLDEAALGLLHRAHQMAVPFENLSIHLAEPISLDEGDLLGKIITRRRGASATSSTAPSRSCCSPSEPRWNGSPRASTATGDSARPSTTSP